jgi:hypothetical protein
MFKLSGSHPYVINAVVRKTQILDAKSLYSLAMTLKTNRIKKKIFSEIRIPTIYLGVNISTYDVKMEEVYSSECYPTTSLRVITTQKTTT